MSALIDWVAKMKGVRVAVIGDVGLDEYVDGEVKRISPEAPVPVLQAQEQKQRLGLSGNVAQNIKSLGGEPVFISVAGEDEAAESICRLLKEEGVSSEGIVRDPRRPTTRKLRVLTGHHHIVRIDFEKRRFVDENVEKKLYAKFESELESCDGVILQDYAKGVLSESVLSSFIKLAREKGKPVFVDPHRSTPLHFYHGATLFKPNFDEAVALSGFPIDSLSHSGDVVDELAKFLLKETGFENLVLTRGSQGMSLFANGQRSDIPTVAKNVFDVTGAGDTVIAALAMSHCAGASFVDSCKIANFAAGVVVSEVGCVPCSAEQLQHSINNI